MYFSLAVLYVVVELFLCVQTLYLASMLIKALWNNALAAKTQLSKQSSFASLLNTNIPMGNKKGVCYLLFDVHAKD